MSVTPEEVGQEDAGKVHAVALQAATSRARQTSAPAPALIEELLSGTQLPDDLLESVTLAFDDASPGQVWPAGKLS